MLVTDEYGIWKTQNGVRILVAGTETEKWVAENTQDPHIITEPIDEEKAAMAEAIIDMDARLSAIEGGV